MDTIELRNELETWRDRKKRAKRMEQFGMLHIAQRRIAALKSKLRRIKTAAA